MIGIFSLILLISLIYIEPHAQARDNKKIEGLDGPVHSVRLVGYEFSPSDGAYQDKPFAKQTVVFDRQGNTLERTLYKSNGSIEHQVNYDYDLTGRKVKWKEYYGEGVGTLPQAYTNHAIYTYDKRGLLSEVTVFQGESIVNKSIYAYDSNGNKIQESLSSPDGANLSRTYKYNSAGKILEETMTGISPSYKVEREYDETGNVVEERKYENGALKSRTINTYDKGKLINAITLKPNGAELSATTNRYNDAGNMIDSTFTDESRKTTTTISYDDNGRIKVKETFTSYAKDRRSRHSHSPDPGKTIIKFDENGKEVEHIYYNESGAQSQRWTSSYNDRSKLIESVNYKADGKIEGKVTFEYDLYGNFIKRSNTIITAAGELRSSVSERRIITYY